MALTIKQEQYVQELVKGKSQRQAYRDVFDCKGWQDKSIDESASRTFNKIKVKARYNELMDKHRANAIMTCDELLRGLREGFEMALGIKPTKKMVTQFLTDKIVPIEIEGKNTDLRALATIADRIAKLEGWDKQQETMPKIDINITTNGDTTPFKEEE